MIVSQSRSAAGDKVGVYDIDPGAQAMSTVANLGNYFGSAGATSGVVVADASVGKLSLSLAGLNDKGSVVSADIFAIAYSADSANLKGVSAEDIADFAYSQISSQAVVAAGGALSLQAAAITGQTAMTGDVEDADEFMISDAGTLKRVDFCVVRDAVFNDVSGQATVAAGGALSLTVNAISDQTEMTGDVADTDEFMML